MGLESPSIQVSLCCGRDQDKGKCPENPNEIAFFDSFMTEFISDRGQCPILFKVAFQHFEDNVDRMLTIGIWIIPFFQNVFPNMALNQLTHQSVQGAPG